MPYNGAGLYSPPAADFPAVSNTLIQATKFNNTINDIATALSTAITKDGQTTLTANIPFSGFYATNAGIRAIGGSSGAPGIAWNSEPSSGWYRIAANDYGLTIAGTLKQEVTASAFTLSQNLLFTADNTYDIGASAATRARDLFLGRNATVGGTLGVTGTLTAGLVSASVASGAALYGKRTAGDMFRVTPFATNSGVVVESLNSGETDYQPFALLGNGVTIGSRTGVGATVTVASFASGATSLTGTLSITGQAFSTAITALRSTVAKATQQTYLEMWNSTDGQDWAFYRTAGDRSFRLYSTTIGDALVLTQAGGLTVSGTGPHAIGAATFGNVQLRLGGTVPASASGANYGLYQDSSLAPSANDSSVGMYVGPTFSKAGSGTHADFSSILLAVPTINAGAATLTNATTLKIAGAPSVGTNQRALWVVAGTAQFDGVVTVGTTFQGGSTTAGDIVLANAKAIRAVNGAASDSIRLIYADSGNNANIPQPLIVGGALTYGGVTLSNSVVGTGSMVLGTETTWTPGLSFGGAAVGITYSAQTGTYERHGRLCIARFNFGLSAKGSSTGAAKITGFPFAFGSANCVGSCRWGGLATGVVSMVLLGDNGATTATIQGSNGATTTQPNMDDTWFTAVTTLTGTIAYQV